MAAEPWMRAWVANTFTATCRCGWAGVVRNTSAQASRDLITHQHTHKGNK